MALERIADEVRNCTACRLHRGRTRAVPGEGHPDTEVVFIGEGPGQNEDQQGRPFVGAAGGLLEELLGRVGWRRDEVFITNVVKCRPPGNRDPEPDEIMACSGFLRRQLEILDPAIVVTLGRFSLGTFMPGAKISAAHGTVRPVDPSTGASSAVAFAMYHPAAAFRQANLRETLVADMANLPQVLLDAREARSARAGDANGDVAPEATAVMEDGSTDAQAPPAVPADGPVEGGVPLGAERPRAARAEPVDGAGEPRARARRPVRDVPPAGAPPAEPLAPPSDPAAPFPVEPAPSPKPASSVAPPPPSVAPPPPPPGTEADELGALSDLALPDATVTVPPDEEPNDQMTLF